MTLTPGPLPPSGTPRRPSVWPVFAAYAGVVAWLLGIEFGLLTAWLAMQGLPPEATVDFEQTPGLVVLSLLVSSGSLLAAALLGARPGAEPTARRLRTGPARVSARWVAAAVVGLLALSQAFDSLLTLLGWAEEGTLGMLHRLIAGMSAGMLVLMLVVAGLLAATAEEVFFRGFMQTRLVERWGAGPGIMVTAAAFGLLHFDTLHAPFAFAVGLVLGWVTEWSGSVRPAIAAHAVNNGVSVLQAALLPRPATRATEAVLLVAAAALAALAIARLRRHAPRLGDAAG